MNTISTFFELAYCCNYSYDALNYACTKFLAALAVAEMLNSLAAYIVREVFSEMDVALNLADVTSYFCHSCVLFTFYMARWHDAMVRSDHCDDFSLDLRKQAPWQAPVRMRRAARTPWIQAFSLLEIVRDLRRTGEVTYLDLNGLCT